MKVKDVTNYLESIAPLQLQEDYDNSGLIIGNGDDKVEGALVCLDVTEEVIREAISLGCNLIIAHHPLIFSGIRKINTNNYPSSCVVLAIKNNLNIYAIHTNLDNVPKGVNGKIADLLQLSNRKILLPKQHLIKIAVYVPKDHFSKVSDAMFDAGAGHIGNYSHCSFSSSGQGTFMPHADANPHIGQKNQLEKVEEHKLEMVVPNHLLFKVLNAMTKAHPYEEVAYDIFHLLNSSNYGAGIIGELKTPLSEMEFLQKLKTTFNADGIRYTNLLKKKIKKVAVCGGSGSFLLNNAIAQNADILVTSDFKYHQFFDANNQILIADIGHYESEQFTIDLIGDILMKKFTNFAIRLTTVNTNPINYI